ncbi:MAG: helix-turn-helix domain-containing protein [Trebonia sp.]
MANQNLHRALQHAGLDPEQLADLVGVDARSIRRWLAGGTPYARHRRQLARALETSEQELWPGLADRADTTADAERAPAQPQPAATDDHDSSDTDADTSGRDSRAPDSTSSTAAKDARQRIYLHGQDMHDWPGVAELLIAKASHGCQIRLLLATPNPAIPTALFTAEQIEIRQATGPQHPATQIIDDHIVISVPISTQPDQPQIALHLTAQSHPDIFTRLVQHYQQVWEHSQPLEPQHDGKSDVDRPDGDPPDSDPHEPQRSHDSKPDAADRPAQPDTQQPTTTPAPPATTRRWPGRRA